MRSIMIVAADKTEKLAEFFTERGTFTVDYAFESLSTNVMQIKDAIINVDKLLYVYQDDTINIRSDMQVLKESLTSGAFFSVKEIVFITSDTQGSNIAKTYFGSVVESTKFENYVIKTIPGRLTFAAIYDAVLGISSVAHVKNTFKTVYRVERGDSAKKAFIPKDDSNLSVETFDDSNQQDLEARKASIINTESGIPRRDQDNGTNIKTYYNPVIKSVPLNTAAFDKNTVVISGDRKSGVSTWTTALAVSASKLGKPVVVFDFTINSDISNLFDENNIDYKLYRMSELLRSFTLGQNINICTVFNAKERKVRLELLRYLYETTALLNSQVFIAIDNMMLQYVIDILRNKISRVLYCIIPLKSDVLLAQEPLNQIAIENDLVIILNKDIKLMPKSSYMAEPQIKELFVNCKAIIRSIYFTDFSLDEEIFINIMEV